MLNEQEIMMITNALDKNIKGIRIEVINDNPFILLTRSVIKKPIVGYSRERKRFTISNDEFDGLCIASVPFDEISDLNIKEGNTWTEIMVGVRGVIQRMFIIHE